VSKGQVELGRERQVGDYMSRLTEIPEMLRHNKTRDKGTN